MGRLVPDAWTGVRLGALTQDGAGTGGCEVGAVKVGRGTLGSSR